LQLAHAGDIDDTVVLHPITTGVQNLWLYHAIIPAQIALDDFGTKANIKPTGSVIVEVSMARHVRLCGLVEELVVVELGVGHSLERPRRRPFELLPVGSAQPRGSPVRGTEPPRRIGSEGRRPPPRPTATRPP
jgi:hypothetical protein